MAPFFYCEQASSESRLLHGLPPQRVRLVLFDKGILARTVALDIMLTARGYRLL